MKLRNVLVQYDLWIVTHDDDVASDIALAIIRGGEEPNEVTTYTIQKARDIPARLQEERPFVASTVTDEEWAPYDGSTITSIFERLNERPST